MRVGSNPFKAETAVYVPKEITVAVLVYIPFLTGYFTQSLEVLKLCLLSLIKNADIPFDLMVFDNGSCEEVKNYLSGEYEKGNIHYLFLSHHNVGKTGAWNFIFGSSPGKYTLFSDSDIFFHRNWASKQLKIFQTFPNVGTVTGFAMRRSPSYCNHTVELVKKYQHISVQTGKLIPQDRIDNFMISLGKDPKEYDNKIKNEIDTRISCDGIQAFISAGHFQFMAETSFLKKFLPLPCSSPVGADEKYLDDAVNESESLRLATEEVIVEHIGNALSEKWKQELQVLESDGRIPLKNQNSNKNNFFRNKLIKGIAVRVINRLSKLFNKIMIYYSQT